MSLKIGIIQFIQGFKDSYNGLIIFFKEQKKISSSNANDSKSSNYLKLKQRIIQSCILNGLFLLSCILLFNYVLMPFLNLIILKINSNNNFYLSIHHYVNNFIYFSFSFIWIMPVFLLSKIFNFLCYQDIADCAFYRRYKKSNNNYIAYLIAESIFSCTIQIVFLIQSSIFIYLPISILNVLLFHLHISLLYALYAFEYKWFNFGYPIKKRLKDIELKWPYFFGFGISLSILTALFDSYIINATIFAFLFPVLLLSAIEADCNDNPKKPQQQSISKAIEYDFTPLHLFDCSTIVTDYIFRFIKYLSDRRQRANNNANTQ